MVAQVIPRTSFQKLLDGAAKFKNDHPLYAKLNTELELSEVKTWVQDFADRIIKDKACVIPRKMLDEYREELITDLKAVIPTPYLREIGISPQDQARFMERVVEKLENNITETVDTVGISYTTLKVPELKDRVFRLFMDFPLELKPKVSINDYVERLRLASHAVPNEKQRITIRDLAKEIRKDTDAIVELLALSELGFNTSSMVQKEYDDIKARLTQAEGWIKEQNADVVFKSIHGRLKNDAFKNYPAAVEMFVKSTDRAADGKCPYAEALSLRARYPRGNSGEGSGGGYLSH